MKDDHIMESQNFLITDSSDLQLIFTTISCSKVLRKENQGQTFAEIVAACTCIVVECPSFLGIVIPRQYMQILLVLCIIGALSIHCTEL